MWTWQLGSERDILRFEDADNKRDRARARKAFTARPQDRYIGRIQTNPDEVFTGEPCVTPLTDAVIENARAMVVKDRPLTREQFEAVGAVVYEVIATRRQRIPHYLRYDVHGTRSALGRAFIDIFQRLAFLDVLRADVLLDVALAAYPPGRIAYNDFGHLVYSLRQWAMNDLKETRKAAKRDRKDPAPEERRYLDFYAGATPAPIRRDSYRSDLDDDEPDQPQSNDIPDEDAEIARLVRLLPGVDEWLQAQRAKLSQDITALDTLPPEKPWARPIMLKGSEEKNAWLRGRRNDIAWNKARRDGRRRALDSGKLPATAADWERMRVDDAIGDFLADEQTVARLHDRLAVLKSIRRWNDRITPSAHQIRHIGAGERPRHVVVGRGVVAPSAPGPRHGAWPRGYTSSTPMPLAERALLRLGRCGDTTPGAVPLIEHLDSKDWGWKPGDWPAPKLVNVENTHTGRGRKPAYQKVGDVALPPAVPRGCCDLWLNTAHEHDTACNERRWRRSYF